MPSIYCLADVILKTPVDAPYGVQAVNTQGGTYLTMRGVLPQRVSSFGNGDTLQKWPLHACVHAAYPDGIWMLFCKLLACV